jgi:hypothetical protein
MNNCYFDKFYYGIIDEVYAPSNPLNKSKYQYEYRVVITADLYSQIPVRCIKSDGAFGNVNGYEDEVLGKGYKVFVLCPMGDQTLGVIVGGARAHPLVQPENGVYKLRRFNSIEEEVSSDSVWSVQYRDAAKGPISANMALSKSNIKMGDNDANPEQDYIEIDGDSSTITIKAGTWTVNVDSGATLSITGDLNVKCANLNATVQNKATIESAQLEATVKGTAKITANGTASIDAQIIQLNGSGGMVVTTLTHPTDYITGLPIVGEPTVTAGKV